MFVDTSNKDLNVAMITRHTLICNSAFASLAFLGSSSSTRLPIVRRNIVSAGMVASNNFMTHMYRALPNSLHPPCILARSSVAGCDLFKCYTSSKELKVI